jgi:hypothetical protein
MKRHALILSFAIGLAVGAPTQAAPLARQPTAIEVAATSPVELVGGGCGWGGTETIGKTVGETCAGAAALGIGGGDLSSHWLTRCI